MDPYSWKHNISLLALTCVAGGCLVGCGGSTVQAAPETSRKAVRVKPVHLPQLHFHELPSGDLAAVLDTGVYFALDSAELTRRARSQLRGALLPTARDFLASGGEAILLRGYTDGLGGAAYNLNLSRERAGSVAALLVAEGLPAAKVRSRGYGERGARDGVADPRARRVVVVLHRGSR